MAGPGEVHFTSSAMNTAGAAQSASSMAAMATSKARFMKRFR